MLGSNDFPHIRLATAHQQKKQQQIYATMRMHLQWMPIAIWEHIHVVVNGAAVVVDGGAIIFWLSAYESYAGYT